MRGVRLLVLLIGALLAQQAYAQAGIPAGRAGSPSDIVVTIQGATGGLGTPVPVSASQLPATLGTKTSANSVSFTPASDALFPTECLYSTTLPVGSNGNYQVCQSDGRGNVMVYAKGQSITRADGYTAYVSLGVSQDAGASGTPRIFLSSSWLYNGTSADQQRSIQSGDVATGVGVSAVATAVTSSAGQAVPYTTVFGAATSVLKASAGNLYGINANNSTTASFVVAFNGTSAPTSGTALTAANMAYCFSLPASQSSDKVFNPPVRMGTGITLLISTSCTTYTTPGVLPLTLTGYFQ